MRALSIECDTSMHLSMTALPMAQFRFAVAANGRFAALRAVDLATAANDSFPARRAESQCLLWADSGRPLHQVLITALGRKQTSQHEKTPIVDC